MEVPLTGDGGKDVILGLWTLGEGRESQVAEYKVLMGPESTPLPPRPFNPDNVRAGHALQ